MGRIRLIRAALLEVYPQSLAEWLDAFMRDADPESVVVWWERLVACRLEFIAGAGHPAEHRRAAFEILCKRLLGAEDLAQDPDLPRLPAQASRLPPLASVQS